MPLYSARPTLRVETGDAALLARQLIAMEMTESEGGMSALELRFNNQASSPSGSADLAFEDGQTLRIGAKLTVLAGDEMNPTEIFRGTVTAIEGIFSSDSGPELVVLAEDALQKARMARRSAVHEEATLSALANAVAQAAGLTARVEGLEERLGTQVQLNESDLAFLRRLLARYDADLQVIGDELVVAPWSEIRRGSIDLAMYGPLLRARVLADLAHQVTQVTAAGWDPDLGTRVSAKSTGSSLGPGAGHTGARMLQDAMGPRSEHVTEPAVSTDAEARALADAAFDRRARRFVVVEGTTEGNPQLRVGTHLVLTGLGPRFSNSYQVVRAAHRWDGQRGYQTDFEAEGAYLKQA